MKNAATHFRKLTALLKQLRQRPRPEASPPADGVKQLALAFLQWEATTAQARTAYDRLMASLVDINDLRVSHPHEVVRLLGERYPRTEERAARLHDALQEVFRREHCMSLDALAKKGKKDVRAYLDSLPGMVPYVSALTGLLCFAVHGVPVDQQLAEMLTEEGVAETGSGLEQIQAFLEHHVKAEDALEAHFLLQAWVDASTGRGSPRRPAAKTSSAKTPARRK